MLNKNETAYIKQSMVKHSKDIVNLWKNNAIERAFIKYETSRDFLLGFGMALIFDEYLQNELVENGFSYTQFEAFKASFVNYRKNEISTIKVEGGIEND